MDRRDDFEAALDEAIATGDPDLVRGGVTVEDQEDNAKPKPNWRSIPVLEVLNVLVTLPVVVFMCWVIYRSFWNIWPAVLASVAFTVGIVLAIRAVARRL